MSRTGRSWWTRWRRRRGQLRSSSGQVASCQPLLRIRIICVLHPVLHTSNPEGKFESGSSNNTQQTVHWYYLYFETTENATESSVSQFKLKTTYIGNNHIFLVCIGEKISNKLLFYTGLESLLFFRAEMLASVRSYRSRLDMLRSSLRSTQRLSSTSGTLAGGGGGGRSRPGDAYREKVIAGVSSLDRTGESIQRAQQE